MFQRKAYQNKGVDGLGFRDLQMFNLAILTKQAWRLHVMPSSVCAKILKGLYYPHDQVINAKCFTVGSWP